MNDKIAAYVDAHRDEIIAMWEDLVNTESGSSMKAGVDAVANKVKAALEENGAEVRVLEHAEAGNGLVAQMPGGDKKPFLFLGHMDTVFNNPGETIRRPFTIDENGNREIADKNNRLIDYITSKDVSKYNIYCSEGTKVASCCRLLSDADMLSLGEGVNSFGGSQISLGSHRVITTDFARAAYEAESYDDFKKIITERVEESCKILKAHRVLIHKLEKCGTQPWITNGWINMSHMFSTFGCCGYVEADQILKAKFNHKDFDYMKDFLVYFNTECKRISNENKMIWNIEAIPAEGMAPKLAKANKVIFADEDGNYNFETGSYKMPDIEANQWCSLWENHTIYEKMKRDGEINALMTGGSIVHYSVDSKLTSQQAKNMIMKAIDNGADEIDMVINVGRLKDKGVDIYLSGSSLSTMGFCSIVVEIGWKAVLKLSSNAYLRLIFCQTIWYNLRERRI